jgi:ATP-grasp domain
VTGIAGRVSFSGAAPSPGRPPAGRRVVGSPSPATRTSPGGLEAPRYQLTVSHRVTSPGLLLRVSAMVEAHPEVAEMDLNPVIVGTDGAVIVDARVRLETG